MGESEKQEFFRGYFEVFDARKEEDTCLLRNHSYEWMGHGCIMERHCKSSFRKTGRAPCRKHLGALSHLLGLCAPSVCRWESAACHPQPAVKPSRWLESPWPAVSRRHLPQHPAQAASASMYQTPQPKHPAPIITHPALWRRGLHMKIHLQLLEVAH